VLRPAAAPRRRPPERLRSARRRVPARGRKEAIQTHATFAAPLWPRRRSASRPLRTRGEPARPRGIGRGRDHAHRVARRRGSGRRPGEGGPERGAESAGCRGSLRSRAPERLPSTAGRSAKGERDERRQRRARPSRARARSRTARLPTRPRRGQAGARATAAFSSTGRVPERRRAPRREAPPAPRGARPRAGSRGRAEQRRGNPPPRHRSRADGCAANAGRKAAAPGEREHPVPAAQSVPWRPERSDAARKLSARGRIASRRRGTTWSGR
jgi:hypothetical protein